MDHDTKPTHYEPLGFEPTPGSPREAGCMSTMILRQCGYLPFVVASSWIIILGIGMHFTEKVLCVVGGP